MIINSIRRKLEGVVVTNHGIFNIATKRGKTGRFVAWGKVGQIETTCPVREPGDNVWFNFGRTRDEAKRNLMEELGLL